MDTTPLIEQVAAGFALTLDAARPRYRSFSGACVLPATTAAGTDVVLKITTRDDDPAWTGSAKELRFYRDVAGTIGVATPRLLDHRADDEVIALVITRHPAPVPAAQWRLDDWLRLAGDLATIHQQGPYDIGTAHSTTPPADDVVRQYWPDREVAGLLADPSGLERLATPLGRCFVHGDCHLENISWDHGRLTWLDWQGCGTGDPVADLAFPGVRAAPSGTRAPVAEMITHYADRRGLDPDVLRQAVHARELLVWFFEWPHFAAYNTPEGNARVRLRVASLLNGPGDR